MYTRIYAYVSFIVFVTNIQRMQLIPINDESNTMNCRAIKLRCYFVQQKSDASINSILSIPNSGFRLFGRIRKRIRIALCRLSILTLRLLFWYLPPPHVPR